MAPSLASSWSTNYADVVADPDTKYEITFTLTSNVKFHDGTDWNADAAKVNFDQIMGGNGAPGGPKALRGMHDWLGCARMAIPDASCGSSTLSPSRQEIGGF